MNNLKKSEVNTSKNTPVIKEFFDDFPFRGFFDDFFDDVNFSTDLWKKDFSPKIDLVEKDKEYIIKADIPGMEQKDINVELNDGVLSINGEKKEEFKKDEKGVKRVERHYGSFSRSVRLPDNIDTENIAADYKNGVLTVSVQKTEAAEPKKISVKVS
jgi:HSP20 family protein